jgi:hypothetical protein
MFTFRRSFVFLLALVALANAHALEASSFGQFEKLTPGAEKPVSATQAVLADKVTYRFFLTANPGEHQLTIVIYDGSGREAYRALSTLVGRLGPVGVTTSYGFNKARDAAGTWWYVVHLDGRIVLSNSIEVLP